MTYIVLIASVLIGVIIVQSITNLKANAIKLLLAFSGAYLFAVSIFHLLPQVYTGNNKEIGVYLVLGFVLQIILEFFSQGIEHGHGHVSNKTIPMTMLISLAIHAYLEGMPLSGENHHGHNHYHNSLLMGIALHKIPVTIVLMSMFAQAGYSRLKTFILISLFALMAPLGTLTASVIQEVSNYHREITAVVVGIFLHISTTILFESSEGHKFNLKKLLVIGLGSVLAYLA